MFPAAAIPELRRSLLAWYGQQGRDLPWRQTRDPYAIWISEVMLQQTQVQTVIPYYQRWLERFPTVEVLAIADLNAVLKAWEGLGYYSRARNLHRAAQQIVTEHQGRFPESATAVEALPGIGRTTAGGILSAAFNQPQAILDGNVKRVLARLGALPLPPAQAIAQLWQWSEALIDPDQPRDFNQAIMDLGATICTPRKPVCDRCPWSFACAAYNTQMTEQLPLREASSPIPHKQIGVAVIWNDRGQILIDQRKPEGLLGGLWEFPGGKIEAGESIEDCIRREIQEELGIAIAVGDHLISVDHTYTHFRVTLHVHYCQHLEGEPQAIECAEVRWVEPTELSEFAFPKANQQIITAILKSKVQ